MLQMALDGRQAEMWTSIPGILQAFNPAEMAATVQISLMLPFRATSGVLTYEKVTPLVHCPVQFIGGGGYTATFPMAQGDEGLLSFAMRCIDEWWQHGGYSNVLSEFRMHDISDGFFIPGFRSKPRVLSGFSTTTAQFRSDDGLTFVELGPGIINLIADEVNIQGRNKTTIAGAEMIVHGVDKTTFDAGGTGFVYTPATIDDYTEGITPTLHPPNPPEVPT
jgi:hypothetical protein